MIKNHLDKSFGPIGSISGIIIFIVGVGVLFTSLAGLAFVIIGAFIGFTTSDTLIDFDNRKIKFSNSLFGFITTGKWITIEHNMKVGIQKTNKVWRTYSKSNRTLDYAIKDFRVMLYDSNNKLIMPIMKTNSLDSAKVEQEKICNQLGLAII